MKTIQKLPLLFRFSGIPYRSKFQLDYTYYKQLPIADRKDELMRIIEVPRSPIQFSKQIPTFPNEELWQYHSLPLMTYFWEPKQNAKAIIVFFHSLNGHTNVCGLMARNLVAKGFIAAGYDYKNFGKSGGEDRGLVQGLDEIVETSEQFLIRVKQKYPGKKIFTVGMSMGGSVIFKLTQKRTTISNGNIFLNAAIGENKMHIPYTKKLVLLIGAVAPRMKLMSSGGRYGCKYSLGKYITTDPYLYRGRAWAKTLCTMMETSYKLRRQFKNYTAPFLAIQGGLDKLVDPFAVIDLQKLSGSKDKTVVMIADMWHAVWFDDRLGDVTKIVEEWVNQRI